MKSATPISVAATRPHARLQAPKPPSARASDNPVPDQVTVWSMTSRRRCWKRRCSSAAGPATIPLKTTETDMSRMMPAASGAPSRPATGPAVVYIARKSRTLPAVEIALTVPRTVSGSRSQRTTARLTPSSLKLSTARSATIATANVPNSPGPRIRAMSTPTTSVPNLDSAALRKLQPNAPAAVRARPGS